MIYWIVFCDVGQSGPHSFVNNLLPFDIMISEFMTFQVLVHTMTDQTRRHRHSYMTNTRTTRGPR
jgi:hypothetical protein